MEKKKFLKDINIWLFLIPFFIISALYSFTIYTMVDRKIRDNYEHFKEDAIDSARNYSYILQKSTEAEKIINRLLEKKLISAGKTVMLAEGRFTAEIIKNLADSLDVDQVNVFDKNGILRYSNIDSYVGWKATEDHPVYAFMKSGKASSIEEIRADKLSGSYYKYAYYKQPAGEFVQIGITAKDINKFLGSLELKTILDELNKDTAIDQISFIDKDLIVVASTKSEMKGKKIDDDEAILSLKERKEVSSISGVLGNVLYNSFIPLFNGDVYVGTLLVSSKGKEAAYAAAAELKGSIFILVIGLTAIALIMVMIYRSSKNYLKLAYYDKKTGLPNQESLNYFLEKLLKQNRKTGTIFLLNFSIVASLSLSYGHDHAERVFTELASKIKERFEENGITFRVSDDRLVIYSGISNTDQKFKEDFEKMFDFFQGLFPKNESSYLPLEIGIVEISDEDDDPERILKKALIALNKVKNENYLSYQYFNSDMEAIIERENIIEREIIQAIKEEDDEIIRAVFQPQVDLKLGKICGFETLSRMRSKSLGNVSPVEFIEIAERKKLIVPLTKLILKKTSIFVKSLRERSCEGIRVAVNLSGSDIMRPDFIKDLTSFIINSGMENRDLEFEITESVFLDDFKPVNEKLGILRNMGIQISLDDFGTGYSSLSSLRELNIDVVKIDKKFIDGILTDNKDSLIIPDIISMAHKTGLKVLAEGAEEEAQVEYLVESGCDIIQGYFYSKPLEYRDALEIVEKKFPPCSSTSS